jgi:hypothetical protein
VFGCIFLALAIDFSIYTKKQTNKQTNKQTSKAACTCQCDFYFLFFILEWSQQLKILVFLLDTDYTKHQQTASNPLSGPAPFFSP